jgi:hypothetical protein
LTRYSVERTFADPQVSLLGCTLETAHLTRSGHRRITPGRGRSAYGGIRAGIEIARPFLHGDARARTGDGEPQRFASEPCPTSRVLDQLDG